MRVLIVVLTLVGVSFLPGSSCGDKGQEEQIEGDERRTREWGLEKEEVVEFEGTPFPPVGANNPHFWHDKGERSTSKKYDLWEKSDVYLVEWPGNITKLEKKAPLLKWTKFRAKIRVNRCYEFWNGMEMRAYAYKYLHLTWGYNRLTMSYAQPLTIPGDLLFNSGYESKPNTRIVVPVTDFEFMDDALLITTADEGAVIVVYGLGMAQGHLKSGKGPLYPLRYAVAKGITSPVNKLVTQSCCSKPNGDFCPHASTVVAYREYSSDAMLFVSVDGGMNFKKVVIKLEKTSSIIHSVLSFPEQEMGKILVLHGDKNSASLDSYSMSTGTLISGSGRKSAQGNMQLNGIRGMLQASRIGEEMSVIIWDQCNVWYSSFEGKNLTKAVFYVHGHIVNPEKYQTDSRHYLMEESCGFGLNSSLSIGSTGKVGLLDSNNIFFFGIDTKSTRFQLAAIQVDMSLVLPGHSLSIVPNFDLSQSPKLFYPPRYLEVPDKLNLKNYTKRLSMRLLPKTVFPSEFITVFYEENARLPKKFKNFALRPCQTSSLSVNRSITTKPKYYTFNPLTPLNFTIVFKSRINATRQLNYEPKVASNYLEIKRRIASIDETTDNQFIFTYEVEIKARPRNTGSKTFLINFYTKMDLRCIVQPSYPVHIRIDKRSVGYADSSGPQDMLNSKFLSTETKPKEFGKTYSATICPHCMENPLGVASSQCNK